jgi:hypothetical protein
MMKYLNPEEPDSDPSDSVNSAAGDVKYNQQHQDVVLLNSLKRSVLTVNYTRLEM